jgi:acyl carrier protein
LAGIFTKIRKILTDELGIDESAVEPTASLIDDLNMDPDDIAEFFTVIEDEFSKPGNKLEIADDDADKITTVQDMVDYLQEIGIED